MIGADQGLGELLALIAADEGLSVARACKRLGLSRSELQRMLVALGDDVSLGALGLVRVEQREGRALLWLSESAKAAQ